MNKIPLVFRWPWAYSFLAVSFKWYATALFFSHFAVEPKDQSFVLNALIFLGLFMIPFFGLIFGWLANGQAKVYRLEMAKNEANLFKSVNS